jgi:hypothetical protein
MDRKGSGLRVAEPEIEATKSEEGLLSSMIKLNSPICFSLEAHTYFYTNGTNL